MSSGIAPLEADFKGPNTTAEGDFVILSLQTARFLVRSVEQVRTHVCVVVMAEHIKTQKAALQRKCHSNRAALHSPCIAGSQKGRVVLVFWLG